MQDTLYPIFLTIHSVMRWVVILTALFAIIRGITGISFRRGYMAMDNRAGIWFVSAMDLQVLIGIILYLFLSPTTRLIMQNFSGAMSNGQARYFGVEHVILMILALMAAHMGRVFVRRAPNANLKHRRTLFWFVLAILIVLAAIPWPFLMYGRPLI